MKTIEELSRQGRPCITRPKGIFGSLISMVDATMTEIYLESRSVSDVSGSCQLWRELERLGRPYSIRKLIVRLLENPTPNETDLRR